MLLSFINSGAYRLVLILHISTVVIGIGGVFLLGLFGREAGNRKGVEGQAIAETAYKVGEIAEYFIYAIPVFGIALLFMSGNHLLWFDQTWVWLSLILYVAAVGISHVAVNGRLVVRDGVVTDERPGRRLRRGAK